MWAAATLGLVGAGVFFTVGAGVFLAVGAGVFLAVGAGVFLAVGVGAFTGEPKAGVVGFGVAAICRVTHRTWEHSTRYQDASSNMQQHTTHVTSATRVAAAMP